MGTFIPLFWQFFGVFKEQQQANQFGKEFDKVYTDLAIRINDKKKQLGSIVDFLWLEFDTLQMETQLPKDKLKTAIKWVGKVLEKKSFTTHEKLQSLIGLLSFAVKDVCPGQAFFQHFDDTIAKNRKYLHWIKPIRNDLLWWEKFLPQ